ncbi:MAG: putative porin [Gammaproteobacteria bacterium]|nr:putative porin [Gammaproteobacteria bacterium]
MKFTQRITAVAVSFGTMAALVTAPATYAENWSDSIKVKGDFRYRMEKIDQEGREERDRSRLRARISLDAKVNDTVKVGVRLASGSDDPVSTNQSFDKFASTKDFGLDRAFVAWTPAKGSTIIAGKMANPFYLPNKSLLVFDGDLNPEGLAYKYSNAGFFANVGRFNLDECSSCDDSYMTGGQVGYGYKMGNGSKLTFGASLFSYDLNSDEVELPDAYSVTEIFADYSTKLVGRPFVVYADYAVNSDADKVTDQLAALGINEDLDAGYEVGFKYGSAKNAGEWQFGYLYKSADALAVFPLFTDSDFGGGGADVDGHVVKVAYAINKNFTVGINQYVNQNSLSADADNDPLTNALDYNRTMLDFKFKF